MKFALINAIALTGLLAGCDTPVRPSAPELAKLIEDRTADEAWSMLRNRGFGEMDGGRTGDPTAPGGRCFGKASPQPNAGGPFLLLDQIHVCIADKGVYQIYTRPPGAEAWQAYSGLDGENE